MENDLRDYLAANIFLVEKGLTLIGKEYDTHGAGRIDLLCRDKSGVHVVIELKKGKIGHEVVGQALKYRCIRVAIRNPKEYRQVCRKCAIRFEPIRAKAGIFNTALRVLPCGHFWR
jgi:RecB family endonuclease NucS